MKLDSLRTRLTLSHVALVIVLIIIVGLLLVFVLESQIILNNLSIQLNRQAALVAEIAADYPQIWGDEPAAQAFVDRFSQRMTAQLMLLDAEGRILASSDGNDAGMIGQLLAHPDLALVRDQGTTIRTDYSQDLKAEIADILVAAVDSDGHIAGIVRLTHQLSTVQERFQRLRSLIFQILAVGLLLGVILAFLFAWSLERPVERLTEAIYRLASGEELVQLPVKGPSELRVLASGFNNLVERLRILSITRRQLIANLVHEMGRPLGALRLANQALLDGADEDLELRRQLLQGTEAELKTLQLLLEDLVSYYDHALDAMELNLQPTDLGHWLASLAAPWGELAQAKGLNWQADIPVDLPKTAVDPERLGQALGNLIENAIKYTQPGGQITLAAGFEPGWVWIRIADTGRGIPTADQVHIFEPFFRSKGTERLPEGMGLGLTIARDLVAAHNGRLEVSSLPGAGSQFTIWIAETLSPAE